MRKALPLCPFLRKREQKVTARLASKPLVFSRALKGERKLVRSFTGKEGEGQCLVREAD